MMQEFDERPMLPPGGSEAQYKASSMLASAVRGAASFLQPKKQAR